MEIKDIIGKTYIANWLWVPDYGRLYHQTFEVNDLSPKGFAKITIFLPDGKRIKKRVKVKPWGNDGFEIDSLNGSDEVQIQTYKAIDNHLL